MKVVSIVVNSTDLIELQYNSLKKYLKYDDYEFIIFNDAKEFPDYTNNNDITIKRQIEDICKKLQIKCINIQNDHHRYDQNASKRHVDSLNILLQYQKSNPDKYLIIDSDMFLIRDFDITKYFQYEAAVVIQDKIVNNQHIYYPWPGYFYIDMTKTSGIELMDYSLCPGGDTGVLMYKWLMNIIGDSVNIKHNSDMVINNVYFPKNLIAGKWDITDLPSELCSNTILMTFLNNDMRREDNRMFCELYDGAFFHYRSACNWRGEGLAMHKQNIKYLKKML